MERTVVHHDISYGADPRQTLDVYEPASADAGRPVLIFFYGGGWRNGDKKDYAFVGQTMAERGVVTIVVNYRLYPQVDFPEFLSDAAAATAWTILNAPLYGGDSGNVYLMGHSTGAYMAAMLALDGQYLMRDGLKPANLMGVIGLAGLYDFTPAANREYVPIFRNAALPKTQPVAFANGHAPPMLLMTGTNDEVVPASNTVSLAEHLKAVGGRVSVVTYPDIGHIGIMLPFSPLAHNNADIIEKIMVFIMNRGQPVNEKAS